MNDNFLLDSLNYAGNKQIKAIIRALNDGDDLVREMAALVLGNTRSYLACEPLLKALKDSQNPEEIGRALQDYVAMQAGVKPEMMEIPLAVEAYRYYLNKKGLI